MSSSSGNEVLKTGRVVACGAAEGALRIEGAAGGRLLNRLARVADEATACTPGDREGSAGLVCGLPEARVKERPED